MAAAYCYEGIPLRFLASLFDIQMRYLLYMRYQCPQLVVPSMKRIVSSSKTTLSFSPCATTWSITLGSILILTTNAIDPNLLPCGTPPVTFSKSFSKTMRNEIVRSRTTQILVRTDLTPISFIFSNSLLWSIRSKAFRKSRNTILITLCIWNFTGAFIVDVLGIPPYCESEVFPTVSWYFLRTAKDS